MQTKSCTRCGEIKAIDKFAKSRNKSGVSNLCRACHNQSKQDWALHNKEKRKESLKRYYEANYQKVLERTSQWKAENPAKVKESDARRYKKNKDRMLSMNKEWNRTNSIKMRSYCAVRRSQIKSCGGRYHKADIDAIYYQQKGLCTACYKPLNKKFHIDHIIPINLGGSNNKSNIQLLHPVCNMRKSAKHPVDYMQELGFLI